MTIEERIKEAMTEIRQTDKAIDGMLYLPRLIKNLVFEALDAVCAEANSKWGFMDGVCLKPVVGVSYENGQHCFNPHWDITVRVNLHVPDDMVGHQIDWRVVDDEIILEDDADNVRKIEDYIDGIRLRLNPDGPEKAVRELIENNLRVLKFRKNGNE